MANASVGGKNIANAGNEKLELPRLPEPMTERRVGVIGTLALAGCIALSLVPSKARAGFYDGLNIPTQTQLQLGITGDGHQTSFTLVPKLTDGKNIFAAAIIPQKGDPTFIAGTPLKIGNAGILPLVGGTLQGGRMKNPFLNVSGTVLSNDGKEEISGNVGRDSKGNATAGLTLAEQFGPVRMGANVSFAEGGKRTPSLSALVGGPKAMAIVEVTAEEHPKVTITLRLGESIAKVLEKVENFFHKNQ